MLVKRSVSVCVGVCKRQNSENLLRTGIRSRSIQVKSWGYECKTRGRTVIFDLNKWFCVVDCKLLGPGEVKK